MKLSELRENPNNPSKATDEQYTRLEGKLKRVPIGLKAHRIAYVTDDKDGGKMVISGNKRLRMLKKMYGEDAELPDEYFQDVTEMSEAERHEFIVTANVSDGEWDVDRLLEQYDRSEIDELMEQTDVEKLFGERNEWDQLDDIEGDVEMPKPNSPKKLVRVIVPENLIPSVDEIEKIVREQVLPQYPECEVDVL